MVLGNPLGLTAPRSSTSTGRLARMTATPKMPASAVTTMAIQTQLPIDLHQTFDAWGLQGS